MAERNPLVNDLLHIPGDAPLRVQAAKQLLDAVELVEQVAGDADCAGRDSSSRRRRSAHIAGHGLAADVARGVGGEDGAGELGERDARVVGGEDGLGPVDGGGQADGSGAGQQEQRVDGGGGEERRREVDGVRAPARQLLDDVLDRRGVQHRPARVRARRPRPQVRPRPHHLHVRPDVVLHRVPPADALAQQRRVGDRVQRYHVPPQERF